MTTISGKAATAREQARRKDGKFGEQQHDKAEGIDLYDMSWMSDEDPEPEPVEDETPEETSPADPYTFLAHFEQLSDQHEQDFEGYPNRFFTADLRGKYLPPKGSSNEDYYFRANHASGIPQRMYLAASDTSDLKISEQEVQDLAARCQIEDLRPIDPELAKSLRLGSRSWVGMYDGVQVAISDASAGSKNARDFQFRVRPKPPFTERTFVHLDLRALAGNERIKRKTGVDLLPAVTASNHRNISSTKFENGRRVFDHEARDRKERLVQENADNVRTAFEALEDAQVEGRNFLAQKKFMRSAQSSIATAWQDKKHPDAQHVEMAKNTSLAKVFAKVEIDNDVDAESFQRFEQAWEEAKDKLPPIPAGKEPALRIRKLGKHKATGVYFPHVNTIAIDVRDSGSFIHEYGHYVDIAVKGNASLDAQFRDVVRDYEKKLQVPKGTTGKYDHSYYSTPTEVYARGFELYAHERLGIDNRLLKPEKHDRFDFAPFREDPGMKERMFAIFDEAFRR